MPQSTAAPPTTRGVWCTRATAWACSSTAAAPFSGTQHVHRPSSSPPRHMRKRSNRRPLHHAPGLLPTAGSHSCLVTNTCPSTPRTVRYRFTWAAEPVHVERDPLARSRPSSASPSDAHHSDSTAWRYYCLGVLSRNATTGWRRRSMRDVHGRGCVPARRGRPPGSPSSNGRSPWQADWRLGTCGACPWSRVGAAPVVTGPGLQRCFAPGILP